MINGIAGHVAGMLVLLLAGLIGGCGQGSFSPEQRLDRAEAALEKGELRTAIIELKNALQAAPDDREARLLLGEVYARFGDGASAEKELRRARELGASELDIQPWLARALLLQGEFEALDDMEIPASAPTEARAQMLWVKAQALLARGYADAAEGLVQESLQLQPASAPAMFVMAGIQFHHQDEAQARDWIAKALAADAAYGPAWSLLGDLERSLGNLEAAEQAYTRAMEDPSVQDVNRMSRALVLTETGEFERAQEDIALLRKRIKENPRIDYAEGLLHYRKQEYDEAARFAEAALGADPTFATALFLAGASQLALGNVASADNHLSRYLAQYPEDNTARRMMASAKLQLGEAAEAERIVRPLVEGSPGDAVALDLLASALLGQGRGEEGIGYLRRVKEAQPDSAGASARLGAALLEEGDAEEGIRELEKALEAEPQMQEAAARVVMGHVRNGDLDRALEVALENLERNPGSVPAHVTLGVVRLFRKETDAASEAFRKALAMDPGNLPATSALAAIAVEAGDPQRAKDLYLESLEHNPKSTASLVNLAKLAAREGDEVAARGYLEDAIERDPQSLEPRLHLANFYLRNGDPQQCLAVLAELRAANPRQPVLLGLAAEAELALGQYASARTTLEQLRALAPEEPRVRLALAKAHAGLGNEAQARAELEEALRLDPEFVSAIATLGKLAVQRGDVGEAEVRLRELKNSLGTEHPEVLLLEGQVAELKGDTSAATAAYRRLFELSGTGDDLRRLSRVQWKAGEREGAVEILEQWLDTHPDDGDVHFELAERYFLLGREEEAISGYQRALGADPKNVVAMNNLAWLLRERDTNKALEYAERAYSHVPEDAYVMDTLAVLLLATGDLPRAVDISERAVRSQPENGSLLYHRAQILEAAGRPDEARAVLETALQTGREFPERAEAQAMLDNL